MFMITDISFCINCFVPIRKLKNECICYSLNFEPLIKFNGSFEWFKTLLAIIRSKNKYLSLKI